MAFHFPLEAVFHFRQSVEHQQELRLRAANQLVARARHQVDQIDDRMRQMQAQQSRALDAGTTGSEVQFALFRESAIRQQRQDWARELTRLEQVRDQQRSVYQQARRERETFESLRDQQMRDYKRAASRREQRQLDDLHLLRLAHT